MSKEIKISIIEKPDSISWDEIHECLWEAHAQNREQGVNMKFPSLPGSEIQKRIEQNRGKMFVALDGEKIVGVAGYQIKNGNVWYCKSHYLYMCFAGVRPEYNGTGIYKSLYKCRETVAEHLCVPLIVFDTHIQNKRIIAINRYNGFTKVGIKRYGNHYNVVMAKWLGKCPYPGFYLQYRYLLIFFKYKFKNFLKRF